MVKILQAYNFAKQNTFSLNGEILAATLIDSNRIAISSAEQFIEIYDTAAPYEDGAPVHPAEIDERRPSKYTLATVGEVVDLIFCEAGKYLLTLEKDNIGSPVRTTNTISCTSNSTVSYEEDAKMFVRIYTNFIQFPNEKLMFLPITIRIASMTTPKVPMIESIDVIELPLRSPPDMIQCCQTSGNIIVSSRDRIYLYEFAKCTHESTQLRFCYVDFLPFKFFVSLNFIPLKMNLSENVIACMSNRYCVAFKIIDVHGGAAHNGLVQPLDDDYDAEEAGEIDGEELALSSASSFVSKATAGPSSHNSFETDSLETTSSGRGTGGAGFPGRTPIDFNVARMVNSACGREFDVEIQSEWDQCDGMSGGGCSMPSQSDTSQEITITPTRATEIKIKLVNEAKAMKMQRISVEDGIMSSYEEDQSAQYEIRRLLQISMRTSEPSGRIVDILRCMDLKAIYQRRSDTDETEDGEFEVLNQEVPAALTVSKHNNRRSLTSSLHKKCLGYSLLIASSVDGYLYQFCAHGKWYNENEKPIATYSFTAPVLKVHINDYVIYAITTESVETHTSRIGHKLFNNRFEYPSIGELFPEESNPDVNAPIAVIGLCSFMHVQHVCVNSNQLVLISNSLSANNVETLGKKRTASAGGEGKRNIAARLFSEAKAKHSLLRSGSSNHNTSTQQNTLNEWTLYNLEIPRVEHVVEDLETIAESYRAASSSNFYDLMEEAHVMLRLSLLLHFEYLSEAREQNLRELFINNCRKLADFSIRSKKKEVYLQATGFYKMCNIHLTDIYAKFIADFKEKDTHTKTIVFSRGSQPTIATSQLVGLVYAVKQFLFNIGADRLKAAFLNQLVKPFFTPRRVIEQGFPQVPLSLEFLNLFIKYSPADIPQIMLKSPVVADSISGEIINYLKYLDKLNPDENLLLAVTACRMSNYLLSQETLAKSNRRDLAVALIKHKNVLFDDSTTLFQKQRSDYKCSNMCDRTQRYRKQQGAGSLGNDGVTTLKPHANVVSFSDFAETILLATENPELIEAISDAFIHALCVEHSINLETILQLFLNYIASHIGQKGYHTSQKVFATILQVYYYNLLDISTPSRTNDLGSNTPPPHIEDESEEQSSKATSLNSEEDNESLRNSTAESLPSSSSSTSGERRVKDSNKCNRIYYNQLLEQNSPFKRIVHFSALSNEHHVPASTQEEVNLKGLKILFRMYLGRLKTLSDLAMEVDDEIGGSVTSEELITLRAECMKFMVRHLQDHRKSHHGTGHRLYYPKNYVHKDTVANGNTKAVFWPFLPDYKLTGVAYEEHIKKFIRPIPCLLERPQYLNRLPPFKLTDFSFPDKDEGEFDVFFMGWQNELLTLTLKIQSLMSSSKIDREIIEEFISFAQEAPNLIGLESMLIIVLPKSVAINFMQSFCPQYLWHYGRSCNFVPKQWEYLLRKMMLKQESLPNCKEHITEILNNLVADLTFEKLLQCYPSEVIKKCSTFKQLKGPNGECISFRNGQLIYEMEQPRTQLTDAQSTSEQREIPQPMNALPTRDHPPMDSIDEENVFELALRKVVAKQRSIALRSMVESTGAQLFDATNNPLYNL